MPQKVKLTQLEMHRQLKGTFLEHVRAQCAPSQLSLCTALIHTDSRLRFSFYRVPFFVVLIQWLILFASFYEFVLDVFIYCIVPRQHGDAAGTIADSAVSFHLPKRWTGYCKFPPRCECLLPYAQYISLWLENGRKIYWWLPTTYASIINYFQINSFFFCFFFMSVSLLVHGIHTYATDMMDRD